mgnify:CR=1 FL=1
MNGILIKFKNFGMLEFLVIASAAQFTEMGVIFVTSANFMSEPGSEWMVGTCFKAPCVAAGNNELTSIYR